MGYIKSALSIAKKTGRATRSAALKTAATAGKVDRGLTRVENAVDNFKRDVEKSYSPPAKKVHVMRKKPKKKRKPARAWSPMGGSIFD